MPTLATGHLARAARTGALAALVLVAAGYSWLAPEPQGLRFPTGDRITPFHLMLRCRLEIHPECEADATRQLLDLAANLETPYDGPGVTDPDVPLVPGTLTVVYSGAAISWGAADRSSGVATTIAVDLAPLLRESSAYAML